SLTHVDCQAAANLDRLPHVHVDLVIATLHLDDHITNTVKIVAGRDDERGRITIDRGAIEALNREPRRIDRDMKCIIGLIPRDLEISKASHYDTHRTGQKSTRFKFLNVLSRRDGLSAVL